MKLNNLLRFGGATLLLVATVATPAWSKKENKAEEPAVTRTDYSFPHKFTPEQFRRAGNVLYAKSGNKVDNMMGVTLAERGLGVRDFQVSPVNNRFILIFDKKKEVEAEMFGTDEVDHRVAKLPKKKFGELTCALYTPDARKLLLARKDGSIIAVDPRTLEPTWKMQAEFAPTVMEISPNLYYLALTDGKKVIVYNLEEKKLRQSWDFESNVTGMKFNNDASEFAVLTDDGLLSIYDTRSFLIKNDFDNLGDGIAFDYNPDGKWVAVAVAKDDIKVINLLDPSEVINMPVPDGNVTDIAFFPDSENRTLLGITLPDAIHARRMWRLSPYYGKLVKEQADARMNEWMKMLPGETFQDYANRVNDDTRKRQRALIEAEIASSLADDFLSMSTVSLGKYDRANSVLEVNFSNLPPIYLPVSEADLQNFHDGEELEFRNSKYGVMTNDRFELIYSEVYNKKDGKTYIYDNLDRAVLNYMDGDDNVVSIEVIQQQMMEEMKLQALRQKVMEEAKSRQVISDHTNISVNSEVVPDYDANGSRILNYKVNISYEVDPEFSAQEDFAPGNYHADQSGAASSMLKIVKEAFEGDFARYVVPGKKLLVNIVGTADATPIRSSLAYDGVYGDFYEEPVRQNGTLIPMTVTKKDGIATNEQLAFVRAAGVKDFLQKNVGNLEKMNTNYNYNIDVSQDKGSQFRRITVEFIFVNAL